VNKKASLGAIFLTIFLDILGFSLVLPFLAAEARATFGTSELVGTLLGSVYSLMQFLFVPVWGRTSDRIGRRPVLLWSVFASAVSMAGLGVSLIFATSVVWLFLMRIFSGIATANLGTASAYIADVTKPEDRAKGMGLIGVAFGLGFILGPALGGVLAEVQILGRQGAVPCFIAAALSLANVVWVFFGLPESLPHERRDTVAKRSLVPLDLEAAKATFADRGMAMAIFVNFIVLLSFTSLDQTFRFYTQDLFAMSARQTGLTLGVVGIVAAFVQGGLIRPLSARFSEVALIRAGTLLQGLAFAGLALAPRFGLSALYASVGLLAFGNGLTQPSTSAYISRRASAARQGQTLGTSQAVASLSRMLGPAWGGLFYDRFGAAAPYAGAAVGMLIALALSARMTPVRSGLAAEPS
jgi:DHA1 family tetracycline resistance protein-like MFS transporter